MEISSEFIDSSSLELSFKLCLIDRLLVLRTPVGVEKDLTSFFSETGRSWGSEGLLLLEFADGLSV